MKWFRGHRVLFTSTAPSPTWLGASVDSPVTRKCRPGQRTSIKLSARETAVLPPLSFTSHPAPQPSKPQL